MKKTVLILILTALVLLSVSCGKAGEADTESAPDTSSAVPEGETEDTKGAEHVNTDDAPEANGFTLRLPEFFSEGVTYRADDSGVYFEKDGVKLFDILFDSEEGDPAGTVVRDGENVKISVVQYSPEGAGDDYLAVQEGLNEVIANLKEDYPEAVPDDGIYEIDTPFGKLSYPAEWKDTVSVVSEGAAVRFSTNYGVGLFDLYFDGSNGQVVGYIGDAPLSLVVHDVTTDDEYAMQEGVNVILDGLEESGALTRGNPDD